MLAQSGCRAFLLLMLVVEALCAAPRRKNRKKRGRELATALPPAKRSQRNQEGADGGDVDEIMLDFQSFCMGQGVSAALEEGTSESMPKMGISIKFSGLFNEALGPTMRTEALVDYFRLVFNREIRNMLRVQLNINDSSRSLKPGSSADEFLEALVSLELPLFDEQLRLVLYRLCAVLGRMAREEEAPAAWIAADFLAYCGLDVHQRERLYELASELLLSYVDYFWLPDQSGETKGFFAYRAKFESFLKQVQQMRDFELDNFELVNVILEINKWIMAMCIPLGPPTSSIERLEELTRGLRCVDFSLASLSPVFVPEILDATSFQQLLTNMLTLVSLGGPPDAPSIPSLLRNLGLLRHEIPKIAWFYQKSHNGVSLEDALDHWVQLSNTIRAGLTSAFDPELKIFHQLYNMDFESVLRQVRQQFGDLVQFLKQFLGLLTPNQSFHIKWIDPQRSLLALMERSLREAAFYTPRPQLNVGVMCLRITEGLDLDWGTILPTRAPRINFLNQLMPSTSVRSLAETVRLGAAVVTRELEGIKGDVRYLRQLFSLVTLVGGALVPDANKGPLIPESARLGWMGEFLLALLARWQEAGEEERPVIKRWVNGYEKARKDFVVLLDQYLDLVFMDDDVPLEGREFHYPQVLVALKGCEEADREREMLQPKG